MAIDKISYNMKKKPIDIKHINVPNICFSLTDKKDDRETLYSQQRMERGFDDSETWSLRDTICRFTIPRLKRFRECNNGMPCALTKDEWDIIIDKMILAMELITRDNGSRNFTDEESEQVDEGMDLFRKWFMGLWW